MVGLGVRVNGANVVYVVVGLDGVVGVNEVVGSGVNILAWNCKLFPKRIFQDQKLFPRIYFFKFENCFTPLVSYFGFDRISPSVAPLNVWKVASLEPKNIDFFYSFKNQTD